MKTGFGIDIGTNFVKAVVAEQRGTSTHILHAAIAPVPSKALFSEAQFDQEELARALKTMLRDSTIRERTANASLLESQVFTRIIDMPVLSQKELIQALRWEAERYIPLPLEEVNMDFVILGKPEHQTTMQVLLVASPLRLLSKYSTVFDLAGIELSALENEAIAILRLFAGQTINYVVVDIGDTTTNLYLVRRDTPILVRSLGIGGNVMTKTIAAELGLPASQAEEYKRTYGVDPQQLQGSLLNTLQPILTNLLTELTQSLTYFKEKYRDEVISKIILTGGGVLIPKFPLLLQEKLQIETTLLQPWQSMSVEPKVAEQFRGKELMFSVATGLAMRDFT
ncbi:type IV pilus assembly protein PilM [Candidatus Roizmanbacteria bacterium]|nr:type IV pilus assembly protein PilM [Candidatus Roizmanbacteria bacterium]